MGESWDFPADNDRGTETEAITDSSEFILFDSKNITFLYHYSYDDCVEIISVPYSFKWKPSDLGRFQRVL